MTTKNFIWNKENNCISWEYEEKKIKKSFKKINRINKCFNENYIFVEDNNEENKIYYFDLKGNLVLFINYRNKIIYWKFNEKSIKIDKIDFIYASPNFKNKNIFIETNTLYPDYHCLYFSFQGELLFEFNKGIDLLKWKNTDKGVELLNQNIEAALPFFDYGTINIIKWDSSKQKKLLVYSISGEILFIYKPPIGYDFYYLSRSNNKPTVVCIADKEHEDKFGRNHFHFLIDNEKEDLVKESLAY